MFLQSARAATRGLSQPLAHVHRDVWFAGLFLRFPAFRSAGFTPEQLAWFARQPFAAAGQLARYQARPTLVTAGYGCFAAGAVLLCPAFIALARIVAARAPRLASLGGTG